MLSLVRDSNAREDIRRLLTEMERLTAEARAAHAELIRITERYLHGTRKTSEGRNCADALGASGKLER